MLSTVEVIEDRVKLFRYLATICMPMYGSIDAVSGVSGRNTGL